MILIAISVKIDFTGCKNNVIEDGILIYFYQCNTCKIWIHGSGIGTGTQVRSL